MRTPAGKECKYFYGNYFRGMNQEECRLIGDAPPPHHWAPDLCRICSVPGILLANNCENMTLTGRATSGILGKFRKVEIQAFCSKKNDFVKDPKIGCGICHPLPPIFLEEQK